MRHMTQDTLRTRLIIAGLEILQEKGLDALTLRACAARAGVSHAAPAHHFAGLQGLITGIVAKGFARFADTMEEDRKAAVQTPLGQVTGICTGYMRFSKENPALFALMFNTSGTLDDTDADFAAASARAYGLLRDACSPYLPVTDNPNATEVLVWSLVHGLASLQLGGSLKVAEADGNTPTIAELLSGLSLKTKP